MVSWTKTKAGGSTENVDLSDAAKYSGSRIGSPSLTIRSAVDSDEATYVCSATNSIGQGSSSGTVLNVVGGLLTVTVLQTSYSVLLGNTATLGCSWSGIPSASFITWQKVANNVQRATNNVAADINVGASNGKYVGATVSSPSLIITNVDNDDKAQYICTATNTAGRAYSDRTSLDVTGTIPQVQILQDSYSANYGTSITLDCIVTAVPLHTVVTWRKTKSGTATNINVAASSGKYSGGTVSSPSLVINSANLDDEASYVCSAANSIGIGNSSSTVLDIVGGLLTVTIPTGPYSVQVGNSITIPCILSGLPAATQVRWKMIQNTITTDINIASGGGKYAGSLTSTPALTIHNAVKSDSANYQCTATNVVGTSSSQETFLSVFGNVPVVQIPARTYSVNFGGNVIIPCSIQANPLHTSVQWKRFTQGTLQDIDITNSGGKFSGSTLNSPDLVINNAVAADETNYICTATNAIGTGQSFSSFLDVIGGLLTVTIPSNQYSVPAGQDIQLVCKVTGTPAAFSVQWKKITVGRSVTQDINIATSNGHYSGSTVDTPSLTIHNAGETDSANYICTATNAAGVAQSQTTNLNVIGDIPTVVILNPPYTISYGQTITIQCQVTATPSANNIIWTKTINGVDTLINVASSNGKYSGSTVDTPSLTITNTNIKNDEGNYVCSATNSLGTGQSASVFLDVIGGLLTVNVPQAKYTVQQGSSIQMVCSWSGTPSAIAVVWKKYILGVPTDISVTNGKYGGSTVTSPSLTISNADQSDKATYVCTATNAEGTSNSQPVNLEVTGGVPVVRVKQSAYTVNHGSFVILECTVTANPTHTTVQWYRIVNGNPVNVDISKTDKYSGSTVSNPSLTVLSASNADEGNYVCSATNSVGTSQSSQTFLDVLGGMSQKIKEFFDKSMLFKNLKLI